MQTIMDNYFENLRQESHKKIKAEMKNHPKYYSKNG